MRAGMPQDKRFGKIVTYRWLGDFPDAAKAVYLFQQQHPGEALPDSG